MTLFFATPAHAYPEGIFGHHGAESQTCTRCHGGGVRPDVALVGSTDVNGGDTILYTLIITSNAPATQQFAGFNLAIVPPTGSAYAEGLAPVDNGVRAEFSELTHTFPQSNDADGVSRFDFEWTVPDVRGEYTAYFAGNSVDGMNGESGDMSAARTMAINVTADGVITTTNQPPAVSFVEPTAAQFDIGSSVDVAAAVSDDGSISSVQLFVNGDAQRLRVIPPYRWGNAIFNAQAGTYALELVATDDEGVSSSAVLTVTVAADTTPPQPLTVAVSDTKTALPHARIALLFSAFVATVSVVVVNRFWHE